MKLPRLHPALRVLLMLILLSLVPSPTHASSPSQQETTTVQPLLNAVGRVDLAGRHQVVLETGGIVKRVHVEVGDVVKAGDLLVALDTAALEAAVEKAEIGLEGARIGLEELTKEPEASDVAVAEANLLQAEENLALVADGPTEEELMAAKNAVDAAWARFNLLKAGPTEAQINQARAGLAKAEVDLQAAQREYDKIAWQPQAAATATADNLHRATIAYEAAKAGFEIASKPTEAADLLNALSSAQSAQDGYNRLLEKPTPAELADAQAKVAAAENALDKLTRGPEDADVRRAELSVQQALLDLDQAQLNLENAEVRAPIAGTVLELSVEPGQQGGAGSHVSTLSNTDDLKLTVNVEQIDIAQVAPGQDVAIVLYALSDRVFNGVVERIAPVSGTETGSVTFPVTIRFTDDSLDGVRAGMTASANFMPGQATEDTAAEGSSSSD